MTNARLRDLSVLASKEYLIDENLLLNQDYGILNARGIRNSFSIGNVFDPCVVAKRLYS
jgi:hypothetical protein